MKQDRYRSLMCCENLDTLTASVPSCLLHARIWLQDAENQEFIEACIRWFMYLCQGLLRLQEEELYSRRVYKFHKWEQEHEHVSDSVGWLFVGKLITGFNWKNYLVIIICLLIMYFCVKTFNWIIIQANLDAMMLIILKKFR